MIVKTDNNNLNEINCNYSNIKNQRCAQVDQVIIFNCRSWKRLYLP